MNKKELIKLGSQTARGGFKNEQDVIDRFNDWEKDEVAQKWLKAMGYEVSDIEYVKAAKVRGQYKADVQVRVRIVIKLKSQLEKIARLADLSLNTIVKVENGVNTNPTIETLTKIAKALEVGVDDLIK